MDAGAWLDESFEGYHELGDHLRGTNCLEVRADGKYAVTASDLEQRCVIHEMDSYGGRTFTVKQIIANRHTVLCVAYAQNGAILLVSTADCKVRGWPLESRTKLLPVLVHDKNVEKMAVGACASLGVQLLCSLCADGSLWLWNAEEHIVLAKLRSRTAFDAEREGRLWREAGWQGHVARILDCALSPDGLLLATASADKTCKVWELQTVLLGSHAEAQEALGIGPAVYLAKIQGAEDAAGTAAILAHSLAHYAPCTHARFQQPASDHASTSTSTTTSSSSAQPPPERMLVTCSLDGTCVGWDAASGVQQWRVSFLGAAPPRLLGLKGHLAAQGGLSVFLIAGAWLYRCAVAAVHVPVRAPGAGDAAATDTAHTLPVQGQGDARSPTGFGAEEAAWLALARLRVLREGLRVADLPAMLAHKYIAPRGLLRLLLPGLSGGGSGSGKRGFGGAGGRAGCEGSWRS